jgi:hypothetical protein
VTEFIDHERRTQSPAHRLDSAWIGQSAQLTQKAIDHALSMIA